ncbi:MAG: DRTGG domain-containing protein [Bacillota bacterium]|nr:DRTGG domain-containing protein [Bacillota bacterium]MDW7677351.1 DRTGG domain-containing protein [Bacillota bacterium]
MNVFELQEKLNLDLVSGKEGTHRQVSGVYIGDMLSWVMAKAQQNNAWITIQTNLNVMAVAVMTDVSCIIVAENAEIPDETIIKSEEEAIPLLRSALTAYQLAARYAGAVDNE